MGFEGLENKEKIIEAHLILKDGDELDDFYGSPLRLKLVGFLREECKFESFPDLIAQINADIHDAKNLLDVAPFQDLGTDSFFETSEPWVGSGGGDETASWEFSLITSELESMAGTETES